MKSCMSLAAIFSLDALAIALDEDAQYPQTLCGASDVLVYPLTSTSPINIPIARHLVIVLERPPQAESPRFNA